MTTVDTTIGPHPTDAVPALPRVVIGVDDSSGARAALRWGLLEAVVRGAEVAVVSTFPLTTFWATPFMLEGPQIQEVRSDVAGVAARVLAEVTAELEATGATGIGALRVEVHAEAGPPALELVERSRGAALLVVGSRGRGAARSLLLGSVALHCAGHAHAPVVVVPVGLPGAGDPPSGPAGRVPRRRVLVGIDGSPASTSGLLAAFAVAGRTGAEVDVVVVHDDADSWAPVSLPRRSAADLRRFAEETAERALVEVRAAAVARGLPEVLCHVDVVAGSAGETLVARSAGAWLLVVGAHGAGQLRDIVLGSVALHCVLHAHCPVLLQHQGDDPGTGRAPVHHLAATVRA